MESFWLGHQNVLREAVRQKCGTPWMVEVRRQLADSRRSDLKIQGARRLIAERGLAETETDIALIATMAVMTP
jgi:hypothetical protein